MKPRAIILIAIAFALPAAALAGPTFSAIHPEEQYPNDAAPLASGGPYEDLLKQVQEKLNARGFDAGPANGTYNAKTQAALAQFQIANVLPASGALDEATLAELGVERGATSAPEDIASEEKPGEEQPSEEKLSERPG